MILLEHRRFPKSIQNQLRCYTVIPKPQSFFLWLLEVHVPAISNSEERLYYVV